MHESIERVHAADIVDNEHGSASLIIDFRSQGTDQGWILNPTSALIYKILVCFEVRKLQDIVGKPIVVLREAHSYDLIKGIRRLPSDDPYEVII